MEIYSNERFRSGDTCVAAGRYAFDGYVDGASDAVPPLLEISLRAGGVFPMFPACSGVRRACYWKPVADNEATAAAPAMMVGTA